MIFHAVALDRRTARLADGDAGALGGQLFAQPGQLRLVEGSEATDLAVDRAQVPHRLHDVSGAGLTL